MAHARANNLPRFAASVIRPALVEARLLTKKHADDAVYVASLAEELRTIEAKIAAMEEATLGGCNSAAVQIGSLPAAEDSQDAGWIRTKSHELDARLRRVERSTMQP